MDSEFLNDLFSEQSNVLDPNSLSGSGSKSYDSFGPNRDQYQGKDLDCGAIIDGNPLNCPLSWHESIISSHVEPTIADGWPFYTAVQSNPSLTHFDTNHQLPFFLHSEVDSDLSLFDLPNTLEQISHVQNDNFFLGSSSISMVEDTSLDPFGSLFADSPSDGHCNNQVIGAPKSSESSVNSNIGASRRHFSEHLPTKLYPELDGIEHSLDSRPQQSHESQNKLQSSGRTGSTSGYIIISERLGISGTVLEPRPFLPPPEQLMTTFESKYPKTTVSKGKKAYTVEGRKKVGQVRKIGACWQCQIRKIACSVDKICKRCQKMASTPTLAKQICLRQRFMDIYLSHSSIYEMIIQSQERNIVSIRFRPRITEQVSLRSEAMAEDCPTLTLSVITYERISPDPGLSGSYSRPFLPDEFPTHAPTGTPYKHIYPNSGLSGSYTRPVSWHSLSADSQAMIRRAMLPDSVPSVEQLENMSKPGTCKVHDPFLNHDLHDRIDDILLLFSNQGRHQPLHELVAATLRIVNLRSFLMYSLVYTHNSFYADPVLNQNIRAVALAGISKAERLIISQFNDLSRLVSLESFSMIIAKICLLRLLLIYRNDVLLCARSVKFPVRSRGIFVTRLEKVKFMYRVAATTFGILCERAPSFALCEWSDNVQQNDLAQSDAALLATAIKELGAGYTNFCEQELSQEHDEVLLLFIKRSARK